MINAPFKYSKLKIDNKSYLYAVDIEDYHPEFSKFIDDNIVSICLPYETIYDLKTIKSKILKFLNSKKEKGKNGQSNTIITGYICEFIVHLFFKFLGYKQEFNFFIWKTEVQ